MQTLCSAPAKLIISGEHSVVYGAPALSMAIERYAQCRCELDEQKASSLTIILDDLNQSQRFELCEWHQIAVELETRFALFQQKTIAIQNVLNTPFELIICAFHLFEQEFGLNRGHWQIQLSSEIPIGRGLGSSAAIIVSVLKSLFAQHQQHCSDMQLLALAKQVESRQHGRSSGLDPATSILGGLIHFDQQCPTKFSETNHPPINAWLIDSGKPQSTTGQAVSQVRQQFADNQPLWQQFSQTTQSLSQAWQNRNIKAVKAAIEKNQQLLNTIGVVPKTIETFIGLLHKQYQASAKICGSGAIKGDNAGIILCIADEPPVDLCRQYGFDINPIAMDLRGAQCQQN